MDGHPAPRGGQNPAYRPARHLPDRSVASAEMETAEQVHRDDRHFDRWSRSYDRSVAQPLFFGPIQRAVVDAVCSHAPAAQAVLDIGCGTGRLLEQMGRAWPDASLIGLDRAGGMLTAARKSRPHLRTARGAAEALPWSDGSFDVVVSTLSFHHWSEQDAGLAEVTRVLRPGGVFALADASADDIPRFATKLLGLLPSHLAVGRGVGHPGGHLLPLADRHRLIEAAGLRIVAERGALHRRWVPMTLAERPQA